jgi:hypothetical protein
MDLLASDASRSRFEAYVEDLASVIGHVDRVVAERMPDRGVLCRCHANAPIQIM